MGTETNESQQKLWFPTKIRELRVAANKKQREVAALLGMKPSSYANAESSNFKRMSLERVHRLARAYGLGRDDTAELVAGWDALPVSDYDKRRDAQHQRVRSVRAKAKAHDPLKLALLEVTTLLVTSVPDPGALCTCSEVDMFAEGSSGQQCELCDALRLLGLSGWTTLDDVIAKLAAVQEGMTG
jgi:transcriptional regulator with XRE-family HTH domain